MKEVGRATRAILPLTSDQIVREFSAPAVLIVDGFLRERSYNLVYGAPGSGKSLFLLSLAYSIASGTPFLGRKVNKSSEVLYVDGESSEQVLAQRVANMRSWKLSFIVDRGLRLEDPDHVQSLLQISREFPVVILDNLTNLSAIDQNIMGEYMQVKEGILTLNEYSTIILAHHTNRRGSMFGTSALSRDPDVVVKLKPIGSLRTVVFKKDRHGIVDHNSTMQFEITDNGIVSTSIENTSLPTRVLIEVQQNSFTREQLTDHLVNEGFVKGTVKVAITRLLSSGKIKYDRDLLVANDDD